MNNNEMYKWAKDLWPICRSLTGDGIRETLRYLKNIIPNLQIKSIPSGEKVFDWVIPDEWNVSEAFVEDESGKRIIDFKNNNLHLVGYSINIDQWITTEELSNHLYSLPLQPNAIPYVTTYYKKDWGFCISDNERKKLKSKQYHVVINSKFTKGHLNYGELIIPGKEKKEIFLSTYICHPSMANNELSGPIVTSALAKWIESLSERKYTYRIIFIPETIGSIAYLSKNLTTLKNNIIAGYNISCVGDDKCYSYLPSRFGKSISDKAALNALSFIDPKFIKYSWLDRGSDERQYCSPGIDLPIATISRSKYGSYPEYHTSLDDLSLISSRGLGGSFNVLSKTIQMIEKNCIPKYTTLCEPMMSDKGIYPTISMKRENDPTKNMMNILTFADGTKDLIEISSLINVPVWDLLEDLDLLINHNLIEII